MKKPFLLFFLLAGCVVAFAQMHVKKHNFSQFYTDERVITPQLEKLSSPAAKSHPEYGITPYNAQCNNCAELIDKRTVDTREYFDRDKPNYVYSQKSYFPLHYKKFEGDSWHTIDRRLRPDRSRPGVFIAPDQPAPTKCDVLNKYTSISGDGFEFVFNHDLRLFFYDENFAYTKPESANYNNYTIGEEGLSVKNVWDGIDMEQVFAAGEIETNYRIEKPLQLPFNRGYMVIEDHFTLPTGYRMIESNGEGGDNAGFRGDYLLLNEKNDTLFLYTRPVYLDVNVTGMHGIYRLFQNAGNYTLQMLVPIDWLQRPTTVYPLLIDPAVIKTGSTVDGFYRSTGGAPNQQNFTTKPGSCDYHMTVQVPGRSKLLDAYMEVEYQLTYSNQCGTPPQPAPYYCTFSQVTQEIRCDQCNTTTGPFKCNPANPPYTGTCTTDSDLVAGAKPFHINSFVPNFIACYSPQCPDYIIPFTLKNQDSTCGDVCGQLCARGNLWGMTVSACRVEGYITQDKTTVCPGEPVTFTAHPSCGVPPYHFAWTIDQGNSYDTIYNSADLVITPQSSIIGVRCFIIDSCAQDPYLSNDLDVTVTQAPPANAGPDVRACAGNKTVQLGGTPTTSPGANVQWIGETPAIQSWLSNANAPNPVLTIPAGLVDTFWLAVRCSAAGFTCQRTDTMLVYSNPLPSPQITAAGATLICGNQSVGLLAGPGYTAYAWNNGSMQQQTTVNQAGDYYVIATDGNGCSDTSNIITVSNIPVPVVNVYPDTTIIYGDSVMLYSDLNLNAASIDSFTWYPFINMSCNTCTNPVVAPQVAQVYGLNVYASGCVVSDSVLIQVILPNNFYIPNAFTPNNDGNNDVFYLLSQSGVKVITFQVFDRIGEKVHDGTYPWDGTYKGKPAPPGVYVYLFRLGLFGEDQAIFRKGSVTLIR